MTVVLALAWSISERDMLRFRQLYPQWMQHYSGISIVVPPNTPAEWVSELENTLKIKIRQGQALIENRRYYALKQALDFPEATSIHYSDGDHALIRLEQYPQDYRRSLAAIIACDCLIIGRSEAVFESYPPALKETERLINQVASYLLGQPVDLGSGSRGFSRQAVEYVMTHASPETHGVATDAEYPVMLHRAGFRIATYESQGAVYEIYDEAHLARLNSAAQWEKRVKQAHMIIEAGIRSAGTVSESAG